MKRNMRIDILFVLIIMLTVPLAACTNGGNAASTETGVVPAEVQNTEVPATATPQPSAYVLVGPEQHVLIAIEQLVEFIAERASTDGVLFEHALTAEEVSRDLSIRIIVWIDQPEEATRWAGENPEAQVVAIPGPAESSLPNLLSIGQGALDSGPIAFLSGYASAVLAPDWRTAIIADTAAEGNGMGAAFYQGSTFYCGLCRPERPPYEDYPLVLPIDPEAPAAWEGALDTLRLAGVDVLYLQGRHANEANLAAITDQGMMAITSTEIAGEGNLALILRYDAVLPLQQRWNAVLAGPIGGVEPLPFLLQPGGEDLVSTGRLNFIQQTGEDLTQGFIGLVE